jgi:hypothetical protein
LAKIQFTDATGVKTKKRQYDDALLIDAWGILKYLLLLKVIAEEEYAG